MITSNSTGSRVSEGEGRVAGNVRESQWRGYVRAIAAGEARGLTSLYDETTSLVYGAALKILRNHADADEVTSDVYIHVWRRAEDFNSSRGSVQAWLIMLVRSRAIDRLRLRERSREGDGPDACSATASSTQTPEQSSWLGQRRRHVRAALEKLTPEQREAIEMAFYSGYTQSELARHLGQPLGTIKTRIRQGMVRLRHNLLLPGSETAP
ncbi:MAG TPA: sigma-70 family RNA polymerase sigma factor [Bryobacteraceae bacterium]|nr:sigma-70 family RNA polymerase sigma factor [Bryobacteraceae bacterium]